MRLQDICALPVADIAATDSALFLWATFPMLPEALRVIGAWGFRFKTVAFVWLKLNRKAFSWFYGMGFWTRSNAEICLLATRGHPKRRDKSIHQFIVSPIEAHSKKPDEARDKIVRLMGDLPRVELFARQPAPGWDVWGNEVQASGQLGQKWKGGNFDPCLNGQSMNKMRDSKKHCTTKDFSFCLSIYGLNEMPKYANYLSLR